MKDQLNVSSASKISMPIANLAMVISLVATVVLMYSSMTQRITSLETSRELMSADLLKKSEQLPVDQEQLMLLEDLYKTTEKIEKRIEDMMHNKVNIQFLQKQMEKALTDIEVLKDKVRANGTK